MKKERKTIVNIQNVYLLGLVLIILILMTTSFTYALFTTSNIKNNVVNIKTGSLGLSIKCDDFNESNQITVAANTEENITIKVTNPNEVPVKYNLYYQLSTTADNTEIGYIESSDAAPDKNGDILTKQGESGDTKTIKINIKNTKDTSITLNIGSNVGLYNKALDFPEGKNIFTKSSKVFVCKRATELHTEECTQTYTNVYCSGAGYTTAGSKGTTTITYGNLGASNILTSGDAFDCDVNGDGVYDKDTERFYYISDLETDNKQSVMIYYNNVVAGLPNNTQWTAYDSHENAYTYGPDTAILQLPTTTQWQNISLSSTTRNIVDELGQVKTTGFSYEGYAARLLTVQEVSKACNRTIVMAHGELDTCNYLMENTPYSNPNITIGYWLETPSSEDTKYASRIYGSYRSVFFKETVTDLVNKSSGIRPAIEIKKSDIDYK